MTKKKKSKIDGLVKILGIVASLATIFGLYIAIFGAPDWSKGFQNQKYTLKANVILSNPNMTNGYFEKGDTLRLEETLTLSWTGVSTCGDDATIKQKYQASFIGWRENTRSLIDSLN